MITCMGELASGTVTFVLTDVEGSTRLWEEHPAIAEAAIRRSRALIVRSVEACGGECPIEQGEGDSTVSVFARAIDAVRAAHEAQVALGEEPWPAGASVRVRMAVHTGDATPAGDGTYAGPVLHRCARLRALAHGGQVVVSDVVGRLVADGLGSLALVDLGEHRLRDLSRAERVWQLAGPGLESQFPPLRSLDALPNNLPVQLSSFVGREAEIAQVVGLLGRARLVTITGSGGCGKTRLAQRVAADVISDHPGGVWWVELAALRDGSGVSAAVAAAMGLRVPPDRTPLDAVADHLADQAALIVLDNCEHLVAGAAALAHELVRRGSAITVLATSREPLAVEGEVTWRVPSLAVPPGDVDATALDRYGASQLFMERALQALPTFLVDDDVAPVVAQISAQLDGIPLAIELAAARVRSLSPRRIASQLDHRFRLLSGGNRTSPKGAFAVGRAADVVGRGVVQAPVVGSM